MIPLSLKVIDIIFCFKFEGCSCTNPIIWLSNHWKTDFFHSFIHIFVSFNDSTWHNWNTSFLEEFLHFRLEFSLLKIFWLSTKNIELFTKSSIQFQPVFVMRFDSVNWSVFIEKKGYRTFNFIQVFQIVYTEVLSQSLFQRLIQLFIRLLTNTKNSDALISKFNCKLLEVLWIVW